MKKLIIIILALVAIVSSCNFHHTCPTYIGAVGPGQHHSAHHPHH